MGIFNNENNEEKELKKICKLVKNSNLESYDIDYLTNYLEEVYEGKRENDFYTLEYLNRIVLNILDWDFSESSYNDMEELFTRLINILTVFLPDGKNTLEFENIMEMFITNFMKAGGEIYDDQLDERLFPLFQNRYTYSEIANLIFRLTDNQETYEETVNFALEIAPYTLNEDILKKEIIAFLNGLDANTNLEEYKKERVSEAKKRCGIYPLDEKELATISREAQKAEALVGKLLELEKKINDYKKYVRESTNAGKKEIAAMTSESLQRIQRSGNENAKKIDELLLKAKEDLLANLNEQCLLLENGLKNSSDAVFRQVLIDAQDKINQIKLSAGRITETTTSELLRIHTMTEESLDKLKDYVENEPQLQDLLKSAQNDDIIREALLKVGELSKDKDASPSLEQTPIGTNLVIPGYDRIVTPANPSIVIPNEKINRHILPAFDEKVSFTERFEAILRKKEELEQRGEIFHEMTNEIIRCILEGDWVYLWGPSGCGKSHSIRQIAELIGIELLDNGKITDKYSIMAYNDPHGRFRATQAFVASTYGKLLLLDEFDNGNTDTQVVLNELYSGLLDTIERPNELRYITFAEDMRVPIHPNFRMISAGNTSGEGGNEAFSSRGKIDESVQQRMTPKKFWYDNRVEQRIFGNYVSWYNIFVNFRQVCDDFAKRQDLDTPLGVVTTRDASAIVRYINHNSKSLEQVIKEKFIQTKNGEYLEFILAEFRRMYGIEQIPDNEYIQDLAICDERIIARKLVRQCQEQIGRI